MTLMFDVFFFQLWMQGIKGGTGLKSDKDSITHRFCVIIVHS